jgi:hypothetical protein
MGTRAVGVDPLTENDFKKLSWGFAKCASPAFFVPFLFLYVPGRTLGATKVETVADGIFGA